MHDQQRRLRRACREKLFHRRQDRFGESRTIDGHKDFSEHRSLRPATLLPAYAFVDPPG
jgi:hypothetical protein